MCAESKKFQLIGRIHGDVFFQNKLLINGVPLQIKLFRSTNEFCLMGDSSYEPKLHLSNAILYVKKIRLNPAILTILTAQARVLNEHNAIYPIVRTDVKILTVF